MRRLLELLEQQDAPRRVVPVSGALDLCEGVRMKADHPRGRRRRRASASSAGIDFTSPWRTAWMRRRISAAVVGSPSARIAGAGPALASSFAAGSMRVTFVLDAAPR